MRVRVPLSLPDFGRGIRRNQRGSLDKLTCIRHAKAIGEVNVEADQSL